MKKYLLSILLLFFCFISFAQWGKGKKRHFKSRSYQYPLYKWTGNYAKHGIQFSFGPSYLLTPIVTPTRTVVTSPGNYLHHNENPSGRIGGFIEIGMVHIAHKRNKIAQYFDWGIGYKHFRGVEQTNVNLYSFHTPSATSGVGKFALGFLYGRFDAHNVAQVGESIFIDNALGFNIDYRLFQKSSYSGTVISGAQRFQNNFVAQLNYNFGVGFKIKDGFYIIPGVNIPFLGIYEWSGGSPAIHWFSSSYFPILLHVKFAWLFKRNPNRCPPVFGGPDDEKLQQQFLNQ